MKFSFLPAFLLPTILLSAQTTPLPPPPSSQQPGDSMPGGTALSCPIRVDEAYVTADPEAMPAEAVGERHTLHVTLVDISGKPVVSYVLHARMAVRPEATPALQPQATTMTRAWTGNLAPDTPTKEHWTFPTERPIAGLRRVWFDKVMFADGTMWRKSANDGCSYAATGRIVQTRGAVSATSPITDSAPE